MNFIDQLKKQGKNNIIESKGDNVVGNLPYDKFKIIKSQVVDGKTLEEWSKVYNVGWEAIRRRMKNIGSPHDKDLKSIKKSKNAIKRFKGAGKVIEGKTIIEWAEHYGVKRNTVDGWLRVRGTVHPNRNQSVFSANKNRVYSKADLDLTNNTSTL